MPSDLLPESINTENETGKDYSFKVKYTQVVKNGLLIPTIEEQQD